MKNISTNTSLPGVTKNKKRMFFLVANTFLLLLFPGIMLAQTAHPATAQVLQLRQTNSFNKALIKQNNKVLPPSTAAVPFSVQQADSVSNPLLQIIQSLVGPGVTVSNIQTTLPQTSNIFGSFTGGTSVIGMESGLIMTSGSVLNAIGPNISTSTSQANGLPGYLAIDTAGFDAAVISFDVTSATSSLSFKYVFASEEYNEYVGSPFNDDFAFLISGPGIAPGTNIALIPGTNTKVDINDVNLGLNSQYYINNDSAANADPFRFQNLEYDGLTTVLNTAAITVVPNATYTITLVIQDVSDEVYDSGVFLQGGSITSDSCVLSTFAEKKDITCTGANNGSIELTFNGANGAVQFLWSNGATTKDIGNLAAGTYTVTLTDSKGCTAILSNLLINDPSALTLGTPIVTSASCGGGGGNNGSAIVSANGGTSPYQYTLNGTTNNSGIFTGFAAGTYNYSATDINGCIITGSFIIPQGSNLTCSIGVIPYRTVAGQARYTIFLGYGPQSVKLRARFINGTPPYTYNWDNGSTKQAIIVSPTSTTTYYLTVTDANGCQSNCSIKIHVKDVRCGQNLNKILICHNASTCPLPPTYCIKLDSVATHLAHGDYLGRCKISAKDESEISIALPGEYGKSLDDNSLQIMVFPNPTSGNFNVQIGSDNENENINLRILDMSGRQIEVRNNLSPDQNLQLGSNYEPGIYMAELTQGSKKITLKLLKYGN
ncbi:MAG: choice-of-anchor L domain-containing protein [Bacteroidia bacterium]